MTGETFPGAAAVGGAIQTASGAAAVHSPGRAPRLPQSSKNDVGIAGIESQVNAAGVFIFVKDFVPGLAAIRGAENSALSVGAEWMTKRRHKCDVCIFRMHNQPANGDRVL